MKMIRLRNQQWLIDGACPFHGLLLDMEEEIDHQWPKLGLRRKECPSYALSVIFDMRVVPLRLSIRSCPDVRTAQSRGCVKAASFERSTDVWRQSPPLSAAT
jgi:hypothetical protein